MAILQIPALLWELIFSRPPVKWRFHRFLWNSYFIPTLRAQHLADQVMADLSPIKWQFHRFLLWQLTFHDSSYFIPTLRAQHLADQVLADLTPHPMVISQIPALLWKLIFGRPLSNGDFTDSCEIHISFLLWELNIWQTRSWQIYPPSNGNFTDSCSDSSHFMTAHISFLLWELNIWQTRSWQIYPHLSGNFTDSCSDSSHFMTAHISFLLWELNIWQTRSWQINPPSYGNFTDCCSDSSYFIRTLRAQYLADKVFADLPPCQMAILQIPVKFLFHFCSKSSTFGRPGLGRSMPLIKGNFTDSCSTLRAHIWQTKFWQIYPLSNGNFTDFCSDSSYFIPTLRANHLADQVLTDLPPPSNGNFTDSCSDSFLL